MRDADTTPRRASGRSLALLAWCADCLAIGIVVLLAWRFIAGAELWIGSVRVASVRDLFRPLRALGIVLLLRHLIVGPGWVGDRGTTALVRRLTAPFGPGIARGIALWTLLGLTTGACHALTRLMTVRHLDLTLARQAGAVLTGMLRDGSWGLLAGVPAALIVSWAARSLAGRPLPAAGTGSAVGESPAAQRERRRALLLSIDLFLIAATFGPWARVERWDLMPRALPVAPRVLTAIGALSILIALALFMPAIARAGRSRLVALIGATSGVALLAAVCSLTPLPRLLFGGEAAGGTPGTDLRSGGSGGPPVGILLITIDTLRADHLGCYGYDRPTTPGIDRLAARGTLFERAYCTMPLTDPSHTSLLTGAYPRTHGILRNGTPIIDPGRLSHLPEYLRGLGYATGAITSRQHLHPGELGIRGFDYYSVPASEEPVRAGETLDRALDWLRFHQGRPWFLWVHFFDPHFPYDPPEEFARPFVPDYRGTIDRGNNYVAASYSAEEIPYMTGLYDGEIAYTDSAVARLVDAVEKAAPAGRAPLIVLTADHGENLAELSESEGYVFAHGEYLTEPQIHVPLIVVREGHVPAGRRIGRVVENFSVAATIAGAATDGPSAFHSQAPDLWTSPPYRSAQGREAIESAVSFEIPEPAAFVQRRYYEAPPRPYHSAEECSIVTERWKLVDNFMRGPDLYDLRSDPGETRNLASVDEVTETDLARRLDAWREAHPVPGEAFGGIPADKLDELRALGYVQ